MTLLQLFTTPYQLVSTSVATEPDADTGDDVTATAEPVDGAPLPRCYFEQLASTETNTARSQIATTAFAAFHAGTTITATDLVVIDGEPWSVIGRPNRVLRRGVEHHVECQLQLVT